MKTKSLSLAFVLAGAWLVAFEGSAGVVGYVNVSITNGYTFVANPLDKGNNTLTNLMLGPPDGTKVYLWDVANQAFAAPATFSDAMPGWDLNFDLSPGKGFVVHSLANWTNTFVGQVLQGRLTVFVPGSNKFSLLGSKVPTSATLSDQHFPGIDGANVYLFRKGTQRYTDAFTCFAGFGWYDPDGAAGTGGPVVPIAESFFVQNPGPNTIWIWNFFVQSTPPPPGSPSLASSPSSATPQIQSIGLRAGTVRLEISSASGAAFNVQFSDDGVAWKPVATNQTGAVWTGASAGGLQGYYRLIAP